MMIKMINENIKRRKGYESDKFAGWSISHLAMAPIRHIKKRDPKRVSISLSSFLSSVLLLEGTFIEFIITCN